MANNTIDNLRKFTLNVSRSNLTILMNVPYNKVYGTGLYLEHSEMRDKTVFVHCKTQDDINHFIVEYNEGDRFGKLLIIKGDVGFIKDIVKKECDHFDSNTIFVH